MISKINQHIRGKCCYIICSSRERGCGVVLFPGAIASRLVPSLSQRANKYSFSKYPAPAPRTNNFKFAITCDDYSMKILSRDQKFDQTIVYWGPRHAL